jgi:hypothetical protein
LLLCRNPVFGGYNWTDRYPWIVEAVLKNRQKQFVIDGEAVILGVDGVSDFKALHSRKQDDEVQLYAFDIFALDGEDLRTLPLSMRKTNLARLLARRPDGIFVAPFEAGEIGPDLFLFVIDGFSKLPSQTMLSTFRPLGSAYRLTTSRYFAVRGFVRCRD